MAAAGVHFNSNYLLYALLFQSDYKCIGRNNHCDGVVSRNVLLSCAACMTNTTATVTSDLLLCLMYSVDMHAYRHTW